MASDDPDFLLFEEFYRSYSRENEQMNILGTVFESNLNAIVSESRKLIELSNQLSIIYFFLNTRHMNDLSTLLSPLKPKKFLAISDSMKIFDKPNHKDRYARLIRYLSNHVTLFVQVSYYMLLTPTNYGAPLRGLLCLSDEDSKFFCFHTFPALFTFFTSPFKIEKGIEFILLMLKLHFYLHPNSIAAPHRFLFHLISAFCFSLNPGRFFNHCLAPLLPKLNEISSQYQYTMIIEEDTTKPKDDPKRIAKRMYRLEYWSEISRFVSLFFENMIKSMPLLPTGIRLLATHILDEFSQFPGSQLLIIEPLICRYLDNFMQSPKISDATTIIRNCYPDDLRSSCNIAPIFDRSQINIKSFLKAIRIPIGPPAPVTKIDEVSYLTPRDLTLIYSGSTYFLRFAIASKMDDFCSLMNDLTKPASQEFDKLIELRHWSVQSQTRPEFLHIPSGIESMIEARSLLAGPTPKLQEFTSIFGTFVSPVSSESMASASMSLSANFASLVPANDAAAASLFEITSGTQLLQDQFDRATTLYIKGNVIPLLLEQYPVEIKSEVLDDRVLSTIVSIVSKYDLLDINARLVYRIYFDTVYDLVDKTFNVQKSVDLTGILARMEIYVTSNQILNMRSPYVNKASEIFKSVNRLAKPSENSALVLTAMDVLTKEKYSDPEPYIAYAVAASRNPDVYAYAGILWNVMTDRQTLNYMFTPKDLELLDHFKRGLIILRRK